MDIKSSDSGVYICRVSTFLNSTSGNVDVRVGFKPRFLTKPERLIQFEEGITAVLDCSAEGIPAPSVRTILSLPYERNNTSNRIKSILSGKF